MKVKELRRIIRECILNERYNENGVFHSDNEITLSAYGFVDRVICHDFSEENSRYLEQLLYKAAKNDDERSKRKLLDFVMEYFDLFDDTIQEAEWYVKKLVEEYRKRTRNSYDHTRLFTQRGRK